MDFDPLSLFTPQVRESDPHVTVSLESTRDFGLLADDQQEHLHPLHILDLPLLQLKPTGEVLLVFLKLLALEEVLNFLTRKNVSGGSRGAGESTSVWEDKNVLNHELTLALPWLQTYCARFNTKLKLHHLPEASSLLKKQFSKEYNAWLTSIVASDLTWIGDDMRETIKKQACLRLAENCGRTAQPEFIRKISIPNLDPFLPKDRYIKLKEPSLTSDNLGLKTWGSSLVLANRLVNSESQYLTSPVLELGSGTGLAGFVSSLMGYNTFLTDLDEIVPNLRDNAILNGIEAEIDTLDWSDPSGFIRKYGDERKFNTIILSDPLYSSKHPYWIVDMMNQFLSSNDGAKVLIQVPLRQNFDSERTLLWDLIAQNFIEKESTIEDGRDDFGDIKFCFKLFERRRSL